MTERDARLRRVYGITAAQYDWLLKKQDGVCAICKSPPKSMRLAVDHDHVSGKIRGLLCFVCNRRLIGRRRDFRLYFRAGFYLYRPPAPSDWPPVPARKKRRKR